MADCCDEKKVCGLYSLIDIEELSLKVVNEIHNISVKFDKELRKAYSYDPTCRIRYAKTLKRLNTYNRVLTYIKKQEVIGSGTCLTADDIQSLFEKIYNIIGKNCVARFDNIKVDTSGEERWALDNPYCRSFEEWERWTKHVCSKLDIILKTDIQSQNFVLELSRKIITPNLLLALSATKEVDRYELVLTRDDEEIIVDHSLLLEKVKSFDLSKKDYLTAVKNGGLSYDIVKTIYDEGLSLEVEDGEVFLKSYLERYNLNDISGSIDISYLKKLGREATINKNDLLQDFK